MAATTLSSHERQVWSDRNRESDRRSIIRELHAAVLLTAELTRTQRICALRGWVIVRSQSGDVFWLDRHHVVKLEGAQATGYCIHARSHDDRGETLLAVKLMLETNLRRFYGAVPGAGEKFGA